MREICNYQDFLAGLKESGFSLGGGNAKGIFALVPYGWEGQAYIDSPVKWHTGDPETDPWEWRMRVLTEECGVSYAKCFFQVGGFITRRWYPYFLAVRRGGDNFQEAYEAGGLRHAAKRIYEAAANGACSLPELKRLGGFDKGETAEFDRALLELQMGLYLTISGQTRRRNQYGEEYGWSCTVFDTTERFWGEAVFQEAQDLDPAEAAAAIRYQVLRLNPQAQEKTIKRFIFG